ncbi:LemA family protein [Eubacteriales bacterium OttesenSCG-928-N13]|nr:LemA family protein [Eubacteriales bacterium OttesenSCG-928-N13]
MRFSENRLIAWIVLAVVVLLSISLYGGGAMKEMRFSVQQIFTDGAQKDGLSINRDLDARADKAAILVSIAGKYLPSDSAALADVKEAADLLTNSAELSDRNDANTKLTRAVETLYTELEQQNLSETDKTNINAAYREIKSRADTISRDTYNAVAREFNQSISRFPANIISGFTGVDELPLFE